MPIPKLLRGHECVDCGEEELEWWDKDETEDTIELYMRCNSCGRDYRKIFVDKSENTSYDAFEERLIEKHLQ